MATESRKAAVEKLAKEIGEHCEDTVGVIDKILLPYTSRDIRNRWVERKLTAYEAATIERCAQIADGFELKVSEETCNTPSPNRLGFCRDLAAAIRALKGE